MSWVLSSTQNPQLVKYNVNQREESYCVGDLVSIIDSKKPNKLAQQYYKVLWKVSSLNYEVEICKYGKCVGNFVYQSLYLIDTPLIIEIYYLYEEIVKFWKWVIIKFYCSTHTSYDIGAV